MVSLWFMSAAHPTQTSPTGPCPRHGEGKPDDRVSGSNAGGREGRKVPLSRVLRKQEEKSLLLCFLAVCRLRSLEATWGRELCWAVVGTNLFSTTNSLAWRNPFWRLLVVVSERSRQQHFASPHRAGQSQCGPEACTASEHLGDAERNPVCTQPSPRCNQMTSHCAEECSCSFCNAGNEDLERTPQPGMLSSSTPPPSTPG